MKQLNITLVVLITLALAACTESEPRLDVTPSVNIHYFDRPGVQVQEIDAGALIDIEYTWRVGPKFHPPKNEMRVFVHFRDSTGNLITNENGISIQDDHDFELPLSQWKANADVVYTREQIRFDKSLGMNNYLVKLYVGIYDVESRQRAILNIPDDQQPENHAYHIATFRLKRNTKIFPRYNDTWHGPEPAPNEEHRWTRKTSSVTFLRDYQAPASDLWISGHSPVEDMEISEQRMWIYIHEQKPEFLVTKEPFIFTSERVLNTCIPIPRKLCETFTDRDIRIFLEVDHTLSTGESDAREELGFRVHNLLLLPRNLER